MTKANDRPRGKEMRSSVWLHIPTFTIGVSEGNFITFKLNGRMVKSYWSIIRKEGKWMFVGYE